MAESEGSCILWARFENTNSEIGPNWVVNGTPIWNPCRFNNGFYSNNDANYLNTVGDGALDPNQSIWEWWMRTDNDVTDGAPADNGYHTYGFWGHDSGGIPAILIANYPAPFYCYVYIKNGAAPPATFQFQNGTWLAGANVHMMLVINPLGIAGGPNTVRLYIDGNLENSSNASLAKFQVADSYKIGGVPWGPGENMEAVVDNLKVYKGTSQALIDAIIANRNNEGFPPPGGFRMLDGGLKSPMLDGAMM